MRLGRLLVSVMLQNETATKHWYQKQKVRECDLKNWKTRKNTMTNEHWQAVNSLLALLRDLRVKQLVSDCYEKVGNTAPRELLNQAIWDVEKYQNAALPRERQEIKHTDIGQMPKDML